MKEEVRSVLPLSVGKMISWDCSFKYECPCCKEKIISSLLRKPKPGEGRASIVPDGIRQSGGFFKQEISIGLSIAIVCPKCLNTSKFPIKKAGEE